MIMGKQSAVKMYWPGGRRRKTCAAATPLIGWERNTDLVNKLWLAFMLSTLVISQF
jgi:hypothetical protein